MKKLLALLMALAMIFPLCACGDFAIDLNKDDKEDEEDSVAGKYLLVSVSVDDEDMSDEDMAEEYGENCYIQLDDDGTAVLKKDGKKLDMEWEDDEIWFADEEDEVCKLKIKKDKLIITMENDDMEVVLTFEKEAEEDEDSDDKDEKKDKDNDKEDDDTDQGSTTQKPDEKMPDYIGTWEYEYKIADTMAETFALVYGDQFKMPTSSMEIFMEITFDADGTYCLEYILNEEAINNYCGELAEAFEDAMYAQYSAMGIDRDQTDEMIEKLYGMSLEEYCLQAAESSLSYEALYNKLVTNNAYGYHKLEDGKIYVTPEKDDWDNIYGYYIYEVDGNELSVEDMYNAETGKLYSDDTLSQSLGSLKLPWVMTRK